MPGAGSPSTGLLSLAGSSSNSGTSSTNRVSGGGSVSFAGLRISGVVVATMLDGATSDDVVVVAVSVSGLASADEPLGASCVAADAPAAAEPVSNDLNSSFGRHASPTHSLSVCTSPAKNLVMPLAALANQCVRRVKREVKKRLVKLLLSASGVVVARSSSLRLKSWTVVIEAIPPWAYRAPSRTAEYC